MTPETQFGVKYRSPEHVRLPHIVKFSGGRTSGMMLMMLLETGILDQKRGDVVVFNNTSAEHPKTYEFVSKCKAVCEGDYRIPFFIIEHCTYEEDYQGRYVRRPTFRLTNDRPHSDSNPQGYRWRGEVYEELLSFNGTLPSVFNRGCSISLKLYATKYFLNDWFANKSATTRRGHTQNTPQVTSAALHKRHIKRGGLVPIEVFSKKKEFMLNQPFVRPAQSWSSFSGAWQPFQNPVLDNHVKIGKGGTEYVSLIGLRHDEKIRVQKVLARANDTSSKNRFPGDVPYAPLFDSGISAADVMKYWSAQTWELELDHRKMLSNCTYCFLKGTNNLRSINHFFDQNPDHVTPDTPTDIAWWQRIESEYAKDFTQEGRSADKQIDDNIMGFFGARGGHLYKYIDGGNVQLEFEEDYPQGFVPCECTD